MSERMKDVKRIRTEEKIRERLGEFGTKWVIKGLMEKEALEQGKVHSHLFIQSFVGYNGIIHRLRASHKGPERRVEYLSFFFAIMVP